MRLEDVEAAVRIVIADAETHAGLFLTVLTDRYAGLEALFRKCAVVIVAKEQTGGCVAGNVDVGPAVGIEIDSDGGERMSGLDGRDTGTLADIGERSVAIVAVQAAWRLRKTRRSAKDRDTNVIAAGIFAAGRDFGGIEDGVVRYEKVELAVTIVGAPRA